MRQPESTHKNEIKLGIDFWHAVEFSRIARTPTRHLPAAHRGNRSNLPDPPSPVKRALIRGSGLVLQGLACWAVDDFSTVFAPSLTTPIRPWARRWFEHAARSNVEALQRRSPPRARPGGRRRPCDVQGRIRPFPRDRPDSTLHIAGATATAWPSARRRTPLQRLDIRPCCMLEPPAGPGADRRGQGRGENGAKVVHGPTGQALQNQP